MSPVLFALALDPFLDLLTRSLPDSTLIRAYADDMAVVMRDFTLVEKLVLPFSILSKAANLNINI